MSPGSILAALSLLTGAAAALLAQEPPSSALPAAPTLRTGTAEVVVDLIVRDKRGRPIRDLTVKDLAIQDDGAAVEIKSLRLVSASGGVTGSGQAAAPADATQPIRLITLVFERMERDAALLARRAGEEIVNKAAGGSVYIAVVQVRQRLQFLQPFTQDKAALRKAVASATGDARIPPDALIAQANTALTGMAESLGQLEQFRRGDFSSIAPPETAIGPVSPGAMAGNALVQQVRVMFNMLKSAEQIDRQQFGRTSLGSLRAAVEAQRELPGRKTLVYFSPGMQIDTAIEHQFRNLIGAANSAGVSIYCVDAAGLTITERNRAASDMLREAAQASMSTVMGGSAEVVKREQVVALDTAEQSARTNNVTALDELASSTGGVLISDSNNLTTPIQRLAEDATSYYEVSYVPAQPRYDGSYRKVAVKVARGGVKVQARQGYFALPPGAGSSVAPFEVPLLNAVSGAERPTAFEYRAGFVQFGNAAGGNARGSVVIELPIRNVELERDDAARLVRLRLGFLALFRAPDGTPAAKVSREVVLQFPAEQAAKVQQGSFTWRELFEVPPGAFDVDTAVADLTGKTVASRRDPFHARAAEPLQVSDLLPVKNLEPVEGPPGDDPLRFGGARIAPSLSTALPVAGGTGALPLFFRVQPPPSEVALSVQYNGSPAGRVKLPMPAGENGPSVPYVASIPAQALRPGRYEFTVEAVQGELRGERKLTVDIEWAPNADRRQSRPEPAVSSGSGSAVVAAADAGPEVSLPVAPLTEAPGAAPPEQTEQDSIIAILRDRAFGYIRNLPNFFCVQSTKRFEDPAGSGTWKARDQLDELLTFVDGHEDFRDLKVKGPGGEKQGSREQGVSSRGEFAGILLAIFDPKAEAKIRWKSWAVLGEEKVHAFEYRIEAAHSKYALSWNGRWEGKNYWEHHPGYQGLILVDPQTLRIRRLTLQADKMPLKFPLQEAQHVVDYDVRRIGGSDYVLPVHAVTQTRFGRRKLLKSEIEFRDYGAWGAKTNIQFDKTP